MINRKKGIVILLTLLLYCFTGIVSAQSKTISIDVKNVGLEQVFSLIEQQSAYKFSYRNSILDQSRDISLKMESEKIEDILQAILPAKGLQYNIAAGNSIVITRIAETRSNQAPQQKRITGNITDEKGEAIIGANIQVKGTATGTITDFDGKFEIEAPVNGTILISYIGYLNESVNIGDRSVINVRLKEDTKLLDEVVVVGYGTQKKVNLTDEPGTGTDIPENNNIRVYTKDRTIMIDAPDAPLDIKVYNLLGNIVREETGFGQHEISLEGIAGNVFIVKVNGRGVKVVVRF